MPPAFSRKRCFLHPASVDTHTIKRLFLESAIAPRLVPLLNTALTPQKAPHGSHAR